MAYHSRMNSDQADSFFEAVLSLETMEECYRFFEDVCTIKEIQSIAQRLEVSKVLKSGKPHKQIEEATAPSTATLRRINRSLNYGAGGYELVFKKIGFIEEE